MPFKRLPEPEPADWCINARKPCYHPEHEPPMHIVLENGTYEYTCPECGRVLVFNVNRPTW